MIAALRDLTRLRYDCAQAATAEKQRLIALMDVAFPEYADHFGDLFGTTSLEVLTAFPTAEALGKVDIRRLTSLMRKASRGRLGRPEAEALKRSARTSLAAGLHREQLALEIRFLLERLNLLLDERSPSTLGIERLDSCCPPDSGDFGEVSQLLHGY